MNSPNKSMVRRLCTQPCICCDPKAGMKWTRDVASSKFVNHLRADLRRGMSHAFEHRPARESRSEASRLPPGWVVSMPNSMPSGPRRPRRAALSRTSLTESSAVFRRLLFLPEMGGELGVTGGYVRCVLGWCAGQVRWVS